MKFNSQWPALVVAMSLGVFLGILLSLPLFPKWKVPSEVLSLFGSVLGAGLGAGIAVVGSLKLLRDEKRQADEQIHQALDMLLGSMIDKLEEFFDSMDPQTLDSDAIDSHLLRLHAYTKSQAFTMERIQSHFSHLGPLHRQVVIDAELSIRRIAEILEKAAQEGGVAYLANPQLEEELIEHVEVLVGVLEWSAESAPGER